ncbi:orf1 [Pseudogymnoascus destructans]|uniref:Anucleate primary sterigmata protein B n=2 Tax=Pseudogymnoascus destructans TaxID=655981 RepID=L8G4R4_PSED2|nr:orf1 [Pseudogymnoascus destructans]ELR08275.1 hypothetical protein GMDG_03076 [Pseudogymnoascus destructans 20631-21]OAF57499.1 orf1 [Pseudogymnoascus destructans]
MTATEDSSPPPAEARITLSRKGSRKGSRKKNVEGFTMATNDDENVAPAKPTSFADSSMDEHQQAFDDNTTTNNNKTAKRFPSLGNLPALPPGESSMMSEDLSREEHSDGYPDTMDESEMRRHLNDVESSFLPGPSPIGQSANPGADDTYLFDGAREPVALADRIPGIRTPTKGAARDEGRQKSFTPMSERETPHVQGSMLGDSLVDNGNTTSSLETMSSPTAAAAARTVSRAISMVSMGYDIEGHVTSDAPSPPQSENGNGEGLSRQGTPRIFEPESLQGTKGDSSDERSTIRHQTSNQSLNAADAGSTPGAALVNRRRSGRRPKFLRSRNASQRSSVSSSVANTDAEENSDMTYGTDYAMLSGGAVPAYGASRHSSYMLSRSISLGSMASGIDDSAELKPVLGTLEEEERNRSRADSSQTADDYANAPATPRATSHSLAAPTDTVIARHVRNVHVPESVAKEYRNKSGVSPGKLPGPSTERHGKNMTLKEQSSTIERLSKENFDLKLKVMFLSDRLDKLSEEGVKEMISENVEMKTVLANMQRDNKALRRKVKELEKSKDGSPRPGTARSGASSESQPQWFDQEGAQEREQELIYLRERMEEYEVEIEKMRTESLSRESEKRKLAETVRSMGEKRGEDMDAREEMDVWKDLLEQETARREEADEDNRKLRDEIFRLRSESVVSGGGAGLNHTTNIYHITKKRQGSPTRPRSGMSERVDDRGGAFSAASTLVDDLRRESDLLRHENAELRREVGAQTSMLTSRNREKERLYQEIEDLKLGHRRGGSIAGDSILDRSASRTRERPQSRGSELTRVTAIIPDAEREDLENKNAELRDKLNGLQLDNQELHKELDSCMEDFETAIESKREAEALAAELQHELQVAESDLQTMQADRDEALKGQEEVEIEFENLRKEAQEEIDALEADAEKRAVEMEGLQVELANQAENFNALQAEMRGMSEALVRLEDDHDLKTRRIQELERELEDANRELNGMEKAIVEANNKINRLTVQQESSQGEIAFLREEQDGDKIKIGDLESALKNAEGAVRDERERVRELEQRLASERHQREVVAGKEKQEVQRYINELNREASNAKDDARRLRKNLSSREVEATEWKERLLELENNLRETLGDLNGTRSTFLKGIGDLQKQLDNTTRELDTTKTSILEKDRIIRERDTLLESHGLEYGILAEMLDKERQAHRNSKHQHETFLKTHNHTTRTVGQQETRVAQLEAALQADRKKLSHLENTFKDQLNERNNLLLTMWNRLSTICGSDWAHGNSLINGRALPSLEAVSTMLPGFAKNLLASTKKIEALIAGFKTRVRTIERDLARDFSSLENTLEARTKKLDRLEGLVRSASMNSSTDQRAEIVRLQDMNRLLRVDIQALRSATPRKGVYEVIEPGSPAPSIPTGPRTKALTRHQATAAANYANAAAAEVPERAGSSAGSTRGSGSRAGAPEGGEDLEWWVFRLKELERRLKAEREARLLDRSEARKRLEEAERRNEELKAEVERGRVRMLAEAGVGGGE